MDFKQSLVFLVMLVIKSTFACNGYTLQVHSVKNCIANGVIRIENPSASLDEDCNIIPSGCVITDKEYQTAEVHYKIIKPPIPTISGVVDLCRAMLDVRDENVISHLNNFGVSRKCPVKPYKVCGSADKKINISKHKNRLSMAAGHVDMRIDIIHNIGRSCVEASFSLIKVRRG